MIGTQTHSNCPCCGAPNETALHSITCPHQGASELWNLEISKLWKWMCNNNGYKEMSNAICDKLNAWRHNWPSPIITTSNRLLREGLQKQDRIWWHNFLQGFIPVEFRHCQRQLLLKIGSQKSSTYSAIDMRFCRFRSIYLSIFGQPQFDTDCHFGHWNRLDRPILAFLLSIFRCIR